MFETRQLTAVSGIEGGINIGGYDVPCDYYSARLYTSAIPLPSVASGSYVDMIPGGHKQCVLQARGTWFADFNPFLDAHLFLMTYKTIRLQIDEGVSDGPAQLLMPSALITEWILSDEVNGRASFELTAVGDYSFNDFSGSPA